MPINKTINLHLIKSDLNYIEKLYAIDPKYEFKKFDTADFVIPPFDYNSAFVLTNFIRTNQNRDRCDFKNRIEWCPLENDTFKFIYKLIINILFDILFSNFLFLPSNQDNLIRNSLNHTFFIKNEIEFKKFKIKL